MTRIPLHSPMFDELERRYDGPPPGGFLRMVALGGRARAETRARTASTRHHQRLAAEACLGAARRRRALSGSEAVLDPWLDRLAATVAHHRHAAIGIARISPARAARALA